MSEEAGVDVPTVTVVAKDSHGVPFDTVKILGDREAVLAVTAAVARVGVLEGALQERDHVIELFQAAIRAHNRWCGYRVEAPGDGALNRALNAAADLTEPGAVLAGGEAGKENP